MQRWLSKDCIVQGAIGLPMSLNLPGSNAIHAYFFDSTCWFCLFFVVFYIMKMIVAHSVSTTVPVNRAPNQISNLRYVKNHVGILAHCSRCGNRNIQLHFLENGISKIQLLQIITNTHCILM